MLYDLTKILLRIPRFLLSIFLQISFYRSQYFRSQIIVEKQNDNQVVWDTKQVTSSKTNLIQYQGKPLVSDTSYTVTITSTSSKDNFF